MTGYVVNGPMLLAKKLGGLLLVVVGLLGLAFGYYYESSLLTTIGVLALVIGAGLLAVKVIRRNASR